MGVRRREPSRACVGRLARLQDRQEAEGCGRSRLLGARVSQIALEFHLVGESERHRGKNIFQGGFLGLDNIGVFDRSAPLPTGGHIEQSDATSWMGMYCLNMLSIALELARENRAYEDVASKFFEHFVYICRAMNNIGGEKIELWNKEDGFFYDVLHLPDGQTLPLKVRSLVGLIPLFAVETLDSELIDSLPRFKHRMQWFIENRPDFSAHVETQSYDGGVRRFLSLVNRTRLKSVLRYMLDEEEFLSPYGIRALSRYHKDHPYLCRRWAWTIEWTMSRPNRARGSSAAIRTGVVRSGFPSTIC